MTASGTLRARIVRVRTEEGQTGLFYATSPDLRGLLVAESTLDELERAIPKAITDLYLAVGIHVVVSRADDEEGGLRPWIAFPAEVARLALREVGGASQ